jgi:2-phosphosulfolactate phosphatase
MLHLDVLFSPAEFAALTGRDLSQTVCVVFDVLRATSSIVTALQNGASAIRPVSDISEALAQRKMDSSILLAGERNGLPIPATLADGVAFDLGNSPREFTPNVVGGKRIAMTTTNGTRALRACSSANRIFVSSFLNLQATAEAITRLAPPNLLIVCSGTFEEAAYEDILGAGALCDLLWSSPDLLPSDAARAATRLYRLESSDLLTAFSQARNGRRLLSLPSLRDDVPFCLRLNSSPFAAELSPEGWIKCA